MLKSRSVDQSALTPDSASPRASFWRVALTVGLVSVCLGMSVFQLWRYDVKATRHQQMQAALAAAPLALSGVPSDAAELELRRVALRGHWLSEKTIFLDNKILNSRVGYQVLTPLQLEVGAMAVLVNRGWVLAPQLRSELPTVKTVIERVELTGIARRFEQRVFELKTETSPGRVWQHVREEDYRKHSGLSPDLKLLPFILLQTSSADDGLVRDWVPPNNPSLHHIGYAVMWFIFALMAIFYGLKVWKRK